MTGSFGGIKAGRAFVLIEAIDMTGKVMNSIRQRLGKFGTEISNVGRTIAMRAAAALLPAGIAVKIGTQYDDIMRKVEARSTGTAAEMQNLREQTTKLGREFGLLPTELGRVQNIFAQAGFTRGEIGHIGPAVALLARAGGEGYDAFMDTENAAKAVTAVLRGFELSADESQMVVDKLAVALNASNYNLEDITTSLQYAVPAAKLYNVELDEMLAILGAMRDLQIDPSIAGTAFRNMMLYMSQEKERTDFNEKLKELTGNTVEFTDALGNLHSPLKVLPALLKATADLGTADRSTLLSGLLETRATIPGAAVGRSVDRMAEMLTLLGKADGVARRVQQQMDSGLGGSFRRLAARIQEAAVRFQEIMSPAMVNLMNEGEKIITTFLEWAIANRGVIVSIVAANVALLGLGIGLIIIGQAMRMLTIGFLAAQAVTSALSLALLVLLNPLTLAAAGIYLAWNAVDDFLEASDRDTDHIASAFSSMAGRVKTSLTDVVSNFVAATKEMRDQWMTSLSQISTSLASGDVQGAMAVLVAQVKLSWFTMVDALIDKWDEFVKFIRGVDSQRGNFLISLIESDFEQRKALGRPIPPAQEEFLKTLKKTFEGQYAESQDDPAKAARQAARDDQLRALKESLAHATEEARIRAAIAEIDAHDEALYRESLSRAVDASAKREELERMAGGLLGAGDIMPASVIKPSQALEKGSVEAAKAIQQDKYGLLKKVDAALASMRGMAADLAAIKSNTATPSVGVV